MQNGRVSPTFPRTDRTGYDMDEVDAFLELARKAYTAEPESVELTSRDIRLTSFRMRRRGYLPAAVDGALERLEDAFAAREREAVLAREGEEAWFASARETAQVVLDRLDRPDGRRFRRVSIFTTGYHPADVDRFARRLVEYFQHGRPLSVQDVRSVAFRPRRGGYLEAQVDLVLDAVTEIMLAVR